MPGFLLHLGATVFCVHGGTATPTAPNPRVLVSGQPVVTLATPYAIAGCPPNVKCATGQWVIGALRVLAGGVPVVLQTGQAVCVPTGTGLVPVITQMRVSAT